MEPIMAEHAILDAHEPSSALRNFYFLRAGVAAVWVVAAFTLCAAYPVVGTFLLVLYPAWDALANALDARANGGFRASPSQAVNAVISVVATVAMIAGAATAGIHAMIAVFGLWAILAGIFQLVTGVRRWGAYGAQWVMILSGAQSVLAGGFFVLQARGPGDLSITSVAGYAGFGAFYFLVSALWLTFRKAKPGV
jgi:uncharacterized membrane protein HdeD (DUF308 family)